MNNKNMIALLKEAPHAAQDLHTVFGLDYNKPFEVYTHAGNFTANSIKKLIPGSVDLFGKNQPLIIILTKSARPYCDRDRYRVATMHTGVFSVNLPARLPYHYENTRLDDYITKGSFEEARKDPEGFTYIIIQRREDLQPVTDKKTDFSQRFNFKNSMEYNNITRCGDGHGATWIGRMYLYNRDDNGSRVEYNTQGRPAAINDFIDKSGYLLESKRDLLKRRANGRRAEKAAAAFKATDNRETIKALRQEAENKKTAIIDELTKATTGAQLSGIGHRIYFYDGLSGIFSALERLEKGEEEKSYSSIEAFERDAARIREKLALI